MFESHRDVADGVRAARRRRVHDEGAGALSYAHEISETAGSTIASNAHIYGPFEPWVLRSTATTSSRAGGARRRRRAYDTAGGLDLGPMIFQVASASRSATNLWRRIRRHRRVVRWTHRRLSLSRWVRVLREWFGDALDQGGRSSVAERRDHSRTTPEGRAYLDACGGHFGTTPDSPSTSVYHYHIQRDAPFTLGCHGRTTRAVWSPSRSAGRSIPACSGTTSTFTINGTTVTYMRDCPCFDAQGKNYGTPTELPAIAQAANGVTSYDVSAWSCRFINNGYDGCIPTLAELAATPSSGTPSSGTPSSGTSRTRSRVIVALSLILATAGATLA